MTAIGLILLFCLPISLPAQPPAPAAPSPSTLSSSISGIVTDSSGAAIAGARIALTRDSLPSAAPLTTTTADDGVFVLPTVAPGAFTLSVTAPGFAAQQTTGQLVPGQPLQLPTLVLQIASSANVQVIATQTEIAQAQMHEEEKQRVLGMLPNFYVSYVSDPVPLTPGQKFNLALNTMIDPVNFALNGVTAAAEQAANIYAWGQGWPAFGKRYAAAYGTFITGNLIGNAALPVLFHQDPRYFYKGTGSVPSRAVYALANAVICKGDNHRWQPNYSAIVGGIAANGISDAYYPAKNRADASIIFESAAIGTGISGLSNLLQEFLIRKLTPHVPTADPDPQATLRHPAPAKP